MKCVLYIPYYGYGDDKFDANGFYGDSNSYIEALRKYSMQDSTEMQYEAKDNEVKYTKCNCTLYDENNEPMTIDKFVGYYNTNELIMIGMEFDLSTMEDDFESELNSWYNDHKRLDDEPNIDEDQRFLVEPKRDLKVVFKNLKDKDTYCTLSNVMMLEKVDNEHYFMIVNKVIFTKKF